MHIYILGICGTFMGSLAILAREMGMQVSGCDANVYPPMSTQLEQQGIELHQGYLPEHLQGDSRPDLIVIGNAMGRGNPCVEYVLDKDLPYTSGPQWLADYVLKDKWVLAVAGTHGKTTTSSMLAWILEFANMAPGYLIGGVPKNFQLSARLGETPFFVIEADEYDSAFFDKRSKFVHYHPRTCILNNLEFDHADIFADIEAIKTQFHHLIRTIPASGKLILPVQQTYLEETLEQGCWTPLQRFSVKAEGQVTASAGVDPGQSAWCAEQLQADGSAFAVWQQLDGQWHKQGEVRWEHTGEHNVSNAMAALQAAHHVGVRAEIACQALSQFSGVKRRLEKIGEQGGISVYDDFAHHPTAIASTLAGVAASRQEQEGRVVLALEPRSNTMRMGVHKEQLDQSVALADKAFWYQSDDQDWELATMLNPKRNQVFNDLAAMEAAILDYLQPGDCLIFMSNGGFGGIHQRLLAALEQSVGIQPEAGFQGGAN